MDGPCGVGRRRILYDVEDPGPVVSAFNQTRCCKGVHNHQLRRIEDLTRRREDPFRTSGRDTSIAVMVSALPAQKGSSAKLTNAWATSDRRGLLATMPSKKESAPLPIHLIVDSSKASKTDYIPQ